MNTRIVRQLLIIPVFSGMMMLASCEHPITFKTDVHEDGTLDKTVTFEKDDSILVDKNFLGINASTGWSVSSEKLKDQTEDNGKDQFRIVFGKHFNSVDEVNAELNRETDTLFRINSTFEKKFRWFYTYIRYSETYAPANRFKKLPSSDYFNREDLQFIERLPAEGKAISKADSVYLQLLQVKIEDTYGNMAIFNEQFEILAALLKRNNVEQRWLDTLVVKRDFIYNQIDKMKDDENFALKMVDTLGIPLQREKAAKDFAELSEDFNSRLGFMGFARDAKIQNIVNMPWQVVSTNADSVSGNTLYWRPLTTKFLITEYVMFAESRRLNTWVVVASGVFVVLTGFALWRRRRRS